MVPFLESAPPAGLVPPLLICYIGAVDAVRRKNPVPLYEDALVAELVDALP
jgi:hypothetical protein